MDRKEAKRLRIGDRVQIWAGRAGACTGTAIEVGYNAVKFEWDDGQVGIIHHNDMQDVARYFGSERIVPASSGPEAA